MNILETDAMVQTNGNLQLLSPLPSWLRPGRVHVFLTTEQPVTQNAGIETNPVSRAPQPGSLKGFRMAEDFDEPLEDFQEYME